MTFLGLPHALQLFEVKRDVAGLPGLRRVRVGTPVVAAVGKLVVGHSVGPGASVHDQVDIAGGSVADRLAVRFVLCLQLAFGVSFMCLLLREIVLMMKFALEGLFFIHEFL